MLGGIFLLVALPSDSDVPLPPPVRHLKCDVVIIGTGIGALTTAYRLANIYGTGLCLFEESNQVGGEVRSVRYNASTDMKPSWTPTFGEQVRGGDSILRCMAQEVGTIMVANSGPGSHTDRYALGINATAFQCFGTQTPTGPATCSGVSRPSDSVLAPNGESGSSPYGVFNINPCGNLDWRQCSYTEKYIEILLNTSNTETIAVTESFGEYVIRILGVNGARYFKDQYGEEYLHFQDARAVIEYLHFDRNYVYGFVSIPHGGLQVGLLNRIAKLITGNGSRIIFNTRIESINRDAHSFKLTTSTGLIVSAKRLVIDVPLRELVDRVSGDVVAEMRETPYVKYSAPIEECFWDAFFPARWWQHYATTCTSGFCATGDRAFTNLSTFAHDNYLAWNYADVDELSPDTLGSLQYTRTPERNENNMLRFYFQDAACRALNAIIDVSGQAGVQSEMMRRLRLRFNTTVLGGGSIPQPIEAHYSTDPDAFAGIAPGAPFGPRDWLNWAAEPLVGEKICLATWTVNMLSYGWVEAFADVAHNCLRGPVFNDVISAELVNATESCRADSVSGGNRILSREIGGDDRCLRLRNEYVILDLAGYNVCSTPPLYQYPTLASFEINQPLLFPFVPT